MKGDMRPNSVHHTHDRKLEPLPVTLAVTGSWSHLLCCGQHGGLAVANEKLIRIARLGGVLNLFCTIHLCLISSFPSCSQDLPSGIANIPFMNMKDPFTE